MRFLGALSLFFCLCASAVMADDLYKWVDADGQVHYSQTPPPTTAVKANAVAVTPKPADPAAVQHSQDLQQRQNAQVRSNAWMDQQRHSANQYQYMYGSNPSGKHKGANCDNLRQQLNNIQGSHWYKTDIDRDKAAQRVQDQINAHC